MAERRKVFAFILLVTVVSTVVMLGLTYNIGCQWEDYPQLFGWTSESTWGKWSFNNAHKQIDWQKLKSDIGNTFYHIEYGIKPLQYDVYYKMLFRFLKDDLFKYHVYKAIVFGAVVFISLLFIHRFTGSLFLCFLGALLLITAPQLWYSTVMLSLVSPISMIFIGIALYLFQSHLEEDSKTKGRWYRLFMIIFLVFLAIQMEQQGRYVVFMLLLYLLLTCPTKIRKNWIFLILLLFLSIPTLGIFYKLLFHPSHKIYVLGSWGMRHYGIDPTNFGQLFSLVRQNFRRMISYLNHFMFLFSILPISIYMVFQKIYSLFYRQKYNLQNRLLIDRYLYIFVWLLFSFALVFYIRGGWIYTRYDNFQYDLSLIWPAYIILFIYGLYVVKNLVKHKIVRNLLLSLIFLSSFGYNVKALNGYIGSLGGHMVSWDNVRKYMEQNIDERNNALLIIRAFHLGCFKPNIKVYSAEIKFYEDTEYAKKICRDNGFLTKYQQIFIASSYIVPAYEGDNDFKIIAELPCYNYALYDRIKWLFKKPWPDRIYIYQYHWNNDAVIQ